MLQDCWKEKCWKHSAERVHAFVERDVRTTIFDSKKWERDKKKIINIRGKSKQGNKANKEQIEER